MKKHPRLSGLFCLAALVLLGVGLFVFLQRTGFFASVRSLPEMRAYMERFQPYSLLLFFVVQLASVVLAPIPSNVMSLAGAALFGTLRAFLLTWAAVTAGSCIVFALARQLGRPFVERFMGRSSMEKYLALAERKRDVFFFMTFLLPGFPDDALCFLAGVTGITFRRFFLLVLLCRPWGLLVSCAVGGNALRLPLWALGLLCAVGLALFLLAMKYGDRWEDAILQKLRAAEKNHPRRK